MLSDNIKKRFIKNPSTMEILFYSITKKLEELGVPDKPTLEYRAWFSITYKHLNKIYIRRAADNQVVLTIIFDNTTSTVGICQHRKGKRHAKFDPANPKFFTYFMRFLCKDVDMAQFQSKPARKSSKSSSWFKS